MPTATTGPSQLPQGENPTPDSGKDEEGDTQGEESSISSVEKESPPAPIAAEEQSLLLDLEGESTSPSPSVTNTPVLPREPLTPVSVPVPKVGSEELTENNSIVVKKESDNTATVKTQAPSTIINPLASVENPKPQEATSTIVKEEFNSKTSCVNKEEKELKQEVQEESFFKEEVPVVSLSKSEEGEFSPSADKDALLEAVNLTLTNIMERAGTLGILLEFVN